MRKREIESASGGGRRSSTAQWMQSHVTHGNIGHGRLSDFFSLYFFVTLLNQLFDLKNDFFF